MEKENFPGQLRPDRRQSVHAAIVNSTLNPKPGILILVRFAITMCAVMSLDTEESA